MNIAIIGYGRMGKEIERVALERGLTVARVFDIQDNADGNGLTKDSLKGVDVCIDFSSPEAAFENIRAVVAAGKNIVVGTTGWYNRLEEVRQIVKKGKTGLVYSSNFSLGMNVFMQVVMDAAHLLGQYPQYDVALWEAHHTGKEDSPSGTALSLATLVLNEFRRKKSILTETSHGKIKPDQLHVSSSRVGSTTGRHSVLFDSDADTIELVHTAKNRGGLAVGAVAAAEWLKGKKGVFTMRDILLG